jgi:hypothetical protein
MASEYTIVFPDYFDDAFEIESKGWFADLVIEARGKRFKPIFYDAHRLRQECEEALSSGAACFVERNLVVVPTLTRANIEAAVARLSRADFLELVPEPEPV